MIALARNAAAELTRDRSALFAQYQESAKREAYHFWKRSRTLWSKMAKEDLVQIALVALLEAAQAYSVHVGAFWPFAASAIRNRFLDALRASKRVEIPVSESMAVDESQEDEVKKERLALLRAAMAQLPGDAYSMFVSRHGLFDQPRKGIREIALEHGVSTSTVQKRLASTKALLESLLLT